jgi:hypothetical protein
MVVSCTVLLIPNARDPAGIAPVFRTGGFRLLS